MTWMEHCSWWTFWICDLDVVQVVLQEGFAVSIVTGCFLLLQSSRSRLRVFVTPAPNGGVIVVVCAVRAAAVAAAGINLVGVSQTKSIQGFPPNFQIMLTTKGSRAD